MATADIEYNRRMHCVTTLLRSIVIGVGSVVDISDFWPSGSWTTGMESSYTSEFAFGLPGTGSVPSTKWQGSHEGGGFGHTSWGERHRSIERWPSARDASNVGIYGDTTLEHAGICGPTPHLDASYRSHPCMRDSRGTGGGKNTRKTGQPDWVITAGPQMVAD